jgi:CO dehydrogenase maturation factor
MKIAFLGKGGSGKTTLSTALVKHMHAGGMNVLAIDADHNMDLSYNLGADPTLFLGSDPDLIKEYVGMKREDTFANTLQTAEGKGIVFTLDPLDAFTKSVSMTIDKNLTLMTAGPHTDRIRTQEACSHSLAAPLKVYLPLLLLKENEVVVIDERAGTDPVATGILKGVDLAVIVEEPTVYSQRVARQIALELKIADVAHIIVENKINGEEVDAARMVSLVTSHFQAVSA